MTTSLQETIKHEEKLIADINADLANEPAYQTMGLPCNEDELRLKSGVRDSLVSLVSSQKGLEQVVIEAREAGLTWTQIGYVFGLNAIECRDKFGDFEI